MQENFFTHTTSKRTKAKKAGAADAAVVVVSACYRALAGALGGVEVTRGITCQNAAHKTRVQAGRSAQIRAIALLRRRIDHTVAAHFESVPKNVIARIRRDDVGCAFALRHDSDRRRTSPRSDFQKLSQAAVDSCVKFERFGNRRDFTE